MLPKDRDAAHLWDMLEAAREAEAMMAKRELDAFLENRMLIRATERLIEIIGEAARHVSAESWQSHPGIPWRKIIGQRNILAHEYGQIDHALLHKTIVDDIPVLIAQQDKILPALDSES